MDNIKKKENMKEDKHIIRKKVQNSNVQKIKDQYEDRIWKERKLELKENRIETICNSPIRKRKQKEEIKKKLNNSLKKLRNSKQPAGMKLIPNNQRSIWEYWGKKDSEKDTRGGTFDPKPNL